MVVQVDIMKQVLEEEALVAQVVPQVVQQVVGLQVQVEIQALE